MTDSSDVAALLRRVGRRLGELRADRGFTQAEFAERVEVSVRYVQSVEGGRENLTLATLAALASALDVDIVELFHLPSRPAPKPGRPKKAKDLDVAKRSSVAKSRR